MNNKAYMITLAVHDSDSGHEIETLTIESSISSIEFDLALSSGLKSLDIDSDSVFSLLDEDAQDRIREAGFTDFSNSAPCEHIDLCLWLVGREVPTFTYKVAKDPVTVVVGMF